MRIFCLGDSNTYGYDPRSYLGGRYTAQDRWVDILAERTGWEVFNGGENGREIPRGYDRVWLDRTLERHRPLDLLVVMLGFNDLLQGADRRQITGRMEALLTSLPLDRRSILLIAPPPMEYGDWVTEEGLLRASAELAGDSQALARRLGVRFADAGEWKIGLTFDGVHFSQGGHRTFADRLYQTITKE